AVTLRLIGLDRRSLMRTARWGTVIVLGLIVSSLSQALADTQSARNRSGATRKNAPDKVWWKDEVLGEGRDAEEARELALAQAAVLIGKQLRETNPGITWKPTIEYIQQDKFLVDDYHIEGASVHQHRLRLEMTWQDYREIVQIDAQERAKPRQQGLA